MNDNNPLKLKAKAERFRNLAEQLRKNGNFHQAAEKFTKAWEIFQQLGMEGEEIFVLIHLANCHKSIGNRTDALLKYGEVLEICENIGNKGVIATCHNKMGMIYLQDLDLDLAMKNFQKTQSIYSALKHEVGMASALQNISGVYIARQEYKKALEKLDRAKEIGIRNLF
ncbi:MAG: tetratricopeptide repeat protein [Promethearchaeota archaeon]